MPSVTTFALAQSALQRAATQQALPDRVDAPFGAVMARQLSVWPFAARTTRLLVLVDPSLPDQPLRDGLLRAMQQGYFASDGYSQTRAVREAALAAHYVLQHHNHDVLPQHQVNAASAVAAVRGPVAFVALAGQAAAYAWRGGQLISQRGIQRSPRPLGLEQDPSITLWRTPLRGEDRLVLVCGTRCSDDHQQAIAAVLSSTSSPSVAQRKLSEALGQTGAAGVLVAGPTTANLQVPHLRLVSTSEPPAASAEAPTPRRTPLRERLSPRRWLFGALGLLLGMVTLAALVFASQPTPLAAHSETSSPRMAVSLGPAAANVVDMSVGTDGLYVLDVAEGAVHAFSLDGVDQQQGAGTIVAARPAVDPVAMAYLPADASAGPGSLAIVDRSRRVFQVGADGELSPRALGSSETWQELGAIGLGPAGELLFLDSAARQLLAYPRAGEPLADEPRLIMDGLTAPRLPFDRVAQVVATSGPLLLRLDDGTVHRLDSTGSDEPLRLRSTEARPPVISAIAPDRAGGIYLADPSNARVLQASADGNVVRELRAPELSSVRALDSSLDGRRLFALVDSGILVLDSPTV